MKEAGDLPLHEVILSLTAEKALSMIGSRADLKAVDSILQALGTTPRIGRVYDPLYEAAKPETPVLIAYAGHYGIYHDIDENDLQVNVVFIEDQRTDPMKRFG